MSPMGLWCQGKPQRHRAKQEGRAARGHQPRGQQEGQTRKDLRNLTCLSISFAGGVGMGKDQTLPNNQKSQQIKQ